MEKRARLAARIEMLTELRDLVGVLRAMAANHLHEAQNALGGIRRYVGIVEEAIVAAGTLLPREIRAAGPALVADREALIVVASEHGFAGAFNERLIDAARDRLTGDRKLGVIGRRGAVLARDAGLPVEWSFPMATHIDGVISTTRRIADELADVATAVILFARYTGGGRFDVEERRILPLDPILLAGAQDENPPLHHLLPLLLVERLAGEYLFAEISRAVMESMASENGARLRVMESASRSIESKVETLTRQDRYLRQEEITTELLDVVTGAEAVAGPRQLGCRYPSLWATI